MIKRLHLSTKGMMQFGGSEERPSPSLLSSRLQKIYNFTFPSTSPFTPPLHPSNQTHPNSYHEQLESFVVRSQLPKKNCYFVREPNWKFSKEKKIILQATILTKNKNTPFRWYFRNNFCSFYHILFAVTDKNNAVDILII